ncbi:STAS domain-containing protein [Nocardioides sp. BP30]|uniref:STAS domain-containing protein n=1 Tax=Nocardioides sp. BP30 TaxID=3036374 RepID=UPI00246969D0|nr:STAS domain-containing protein [Nocardioides sp. BP30]WGL50364.1 STAS domain-containing protein [Nocardioides sp. BP30]
MKLTITRRDSEGASTLALEGSVDLVTRQALVEAGRDVLAEGKALTLDMAAVDFIDSTGLGSLVELSREAAARDAVMVVAPRSPRVERVFELTGLDRVWAAAPSLVSASTVDR